jgi:hypothetical protein
MSSHSASASSSSSSSSGGGGGGGKVPCFICSNVPGEPNRIVLSLSLIWIISMSFGAPFSIAKSRNDSNAFCNEPVQAIE